MVPDADNESQPAQPKPRAVEKAAGEPAVAAVAKAATEPVHAGMEMARAEPPSVSPTARPADPKISPWTAQLQPLAAAFYAWLSRPRVRLTVTGVILLLIGLLMTSSAWTLPLVVAGALMVVVAWIGRRLDGRFAVEWGESGTQLEFRAKIAAPPAPAPSTHAAVSPHQLLVRASERVAHVADTIEGEAHTVEIDVAELEALIAAAETTEAGQSDAPAHTEHELRLAGNRTQAPEAARWEDRRGQV